MYSFDTSFSVFFYSNKNKKNCWTTEKQVLSILGSLENHENHHKHCHYPFFYKSN